MNLIKFLIFLGLVLLSSSGWAEAYLPKNDSEILEHLPVTRGDRNQLKGLRVRLNESPGDLRLTLHLARDYVALGRTHSDPRFYGYAEAILKPWVQPDNLQPDALVLRAAILQNRHDFNAALSDLKSALKLNPRLPQAWLTLAAVFEVQGDYPSALRSCLALAKFSRSLATGVCINSALSLSGQAQSSYHQLILAVTGAQSDPEQLAWAYAILAELAERLDLGKEAEGWYQKAAATGHRSVYLLASHADFLLDHGRPAEVLELLRGETRVDALLLRLTLAEQRLQHKQFQEHSELVRDRIAAAKARGDTVHQGEESRFTLHVLKDQQTALQLAISNWAVQKEPRDARILLEAAVAAKQPNAALPVLQFIERTRLEDRRLSALLKAVKG